MLVIYRDSACCLMNKILSSVLYASLSCPAPLSKAGSNDTSVGQSALCQNISIFWLHIYSSLGICSRLLSLDAVRFPSDPDFAFLSSLTPSAFKQERIPGNPPWSEHCDVSAGRPCTSGALMPCAHKGWIVHLTPWAWAPLIMHICAFVGKRSLFCPSFP